MTGAPMDTDATGGSSPLPFDLDAYAASYSGHARMAHLAYAAQHARNERVRRRAARLLVAFLRGHTLNVDRYRQACEFAHQVGALDVEFDEAWAAAVRGAAPLARSSALLRSLAA